MVCPHHHPTRHRSSPHGAVPRGAAGARPLAHQGAPVRRNTLLRRVRTLALPAKPAPQVVGIDDWAWRKGHRYGTIVVDLARGCPIDLLEDRAAETVATWLQAHPDIKIVARDRAEASAAGSCKGRQRRPRSPIDGIS